MRHHVRAWVNHPFHGLSASVEPTAGMSPAAPSQHHYPVAEATHWSVPVTEGLELWSAGSRGEEDLQGSIPTGREALVQEGRSVLWGRRQAGAGS